MSPYDPDREIRKSAMRWSLFEAFVSALASSFGALLPYLIGAAVVVFGVAITLGVTLKTALVLIIAACLGLGFFAAMMR